MTKRPVRQVNFSPGTGAEGANHKKKSPPSTSQVNFSPDAELEKRLKKMKFYGSLDPVELCFYPYPVSANRRAGNQTPKENPQPQVSFALGLEKTKPFPLSPPSKSRTVPMR